ncbi:Protein of unknown function DUF295 [Macleaya cordata]|uniref:KIB1-4 beta-propeller domain-containing protein n=1 Tax=Macleaya cordata TaxID=56857 RepID=A0A200QZU8_MACCD|nr:Protein of unknown function DUF295 [Macleaya cordata]
MSSDWAQLHPELIEAIANRLSAYIDYIRFRAVCVSWRSVLPKLPNLRHLPPQIPWLMVPFMEDKSQNYGCFFSISENKYHLLELPEFSKKRVCGSSLGWLIMLEEGPAVNLFNPLTRTLIPLPPLTTFPHVKFRPSKLGREFKIYDSTEDDSYTHSLTMMQNCFIRKMVLSSSPSSNNIEAVNYMIVAILSSCKLAFMKKGDQVWTLLNDPEFSFEDVIFYKGQYLAVDSERRVVVCDFDDPSLKVTVISPGPQGEIGFTTHYLVDFSGDLLLVSRVREYEHKGTFDYTTVKFRVFKPDQNGQEWHWPRIKDLGDCVLFLGANSSVCLLANELSGCQRNCIYFADDNHDSYNFKDDDLDDSYEIGGHDLGVFDLNNGSIKANPYHLFNPRFIWPPPIWVTPNPS